MNTEPRSRSQIVIAVALSFIALALVWQTVRQEFGLWYLAGFGTVTETSVETVDIPVEETVVKQVRPGSLSLTTEVIATGTGIGGEGREPVVIDLAPGVWIAELRLSSREDRATVSIESQSGRAGMTWSKSFSVIHVGEGWKDADISGMPAGPAWLTVDMDGPWAVTFDPIRCP